MWDCRQKNLNSKNVIWLVTKNKAVILTVKNIKTAKFIVNKLNRVEQAMERLAGETRRQQEYIEILEDICYEFSKLIEDEAVGWDDIEHANIILELIEQAKGLKQALAKEKSE